MVTIIQNGDAVLRGVANAVPVEDIQSPKIQTVIRDMQKALDEQDDGVAIAAPQIGVPLRIFIVSKRAFMIDKKGKEIPLTDEEKKALENVIYINPEIVNISQKTEWLPEGCLSVRWKYGKVKRSQKATVTAYDATGKKFTRGGSGLMAQIFQHETDHLDGILFIDNAKNVEEAPPSDDA